MKRFTIIDTIRGIAILQMVLYHLIYDLVYLVGIPSTFFDTTFAFAWQRLICSTFIIIGGISFHFSKRRFHKIMILFIIQALISITTVLWMPKERILYGIIFLFFASDLLMTALSKLKIPSLYGIILSLLFLFLTSYIKNITPNVNWFAFLGIRNNSFYSSDYFPVFPWFFLYSFGYYLRPLLPLSKFQIKDNIFSITGKYSLMIYILHQPVLFGLLKIGGLL